MASYITQHLANLTAPPRPLTSIHHDGLKTTTIIPPLSLGPPTTTGTTKKPVTASSTTNQMNPDDGSLSHPFNLETLAHILHAFHQHYNDVDNNHHVQPGTTVTTSNSNDSNSTVVTTTDTKDHCRQPDNKMGTQTGTGMEMETPPSSAGLPTPKLNVSNSPDASGQFATATATATTTNQETMTTSTAPLGKTNEMSITTHPNFDLVETKTTYTIYGDLPGLKRGDVHVETDDLLFTITVSGTLARGFPREVTELVELVDFGLRGGYPHQSGFGYGGHYGDGYGSLERMGSSEGGDTGEKEEKGGRERSVTESSEGDGSSGDDGSTEDGNQEEKDREKMQGNGGTGTRVQDEHEKGNQEGMVHWHVEERPVGRFRRAFRLPTGLVNMAAVSASMEDGLLCITAPKTVAEVYREEVSLRRKVEVGGARWG